MFRQKPGKGADPEAVRLAKLHEISKTINSELDREKLLQLIMDLVIDLTDAERGFVILSEEGEDRVVVARNMDREEVQRPSFKISHSIVQQVRETGVGVLSNDAQAEKDLSAYRSVSDLKLRSILCVPFRVKERVIGVLYLDHRFQKGNFGEEDIKILEMFADQAAIALENVRLHEENRRANAQLAKMNVELQDKVEDQEREIDVIRSKLRSHELEATLKYDYRHIIGDSAPMQRVFQVLDRVIDSNLPVVILGESGTGKELVAKMIHYNGARKDGPFVSENCGAIPESLMEAEIFGYVKGAFTGADRDKPGLLELADNGTFFLDEIGEMDLSLQKRLLRALQEGEFRKVGGDETVSVDVRIVSATNRDLARMVDDGEFRADLYYRLKGVVIELPPLRERKEDIPLLVAHFLEQATEGTDRPPATIEPDVLEALYTYDWPGNVRELENEVRCMATLASGPIDRSLVESLLDTRGRRRASSSDESSFDGKTLAEIEEAAIRRALRITDGKKTEAARMLGIARRTFYDKIKKLEES